MRQKRLQRIARFLRSKNAPKFLSEKFLIPNSSSLSVQCSKYLTSRNEHFRVVEKGERCAKSILQSMWRFSAAGP
jgi:hypothetical protein